MADLAKTKEDLDQVRENAIKHKTLVEGLDESDEVIRL
jgi:hypothetical protein